MRSKAKKPVEKRIVPPLPPKWLGPEGQDCWRETVRILMEKGNVEQIDLRAIAIACSMWERYRMYTAEGDDVAAIRMSAEYIRIMSAFGMTPKSRLKIPEKKKQADKDADADILSAFGIGSDS